MFEKINKIIEMIDEVAPKAVVDQLVELRKQARFQNVSDYEVICVLNGFLAESWATKALDVICGPRPQYDPSRE